MNHLIKFEKKKVMMLRRAVWAKRGGGGLMQSCCWNWKRFFSSSSFSSSTWRSDDVDVEEEKKEVLFPNLAPPKTPLLPSLLLQPRVLIYDGLCHLCHNGVKWVIRVDKYAKIKFCCLQSTAAEPYLKFSGLDREDVLGRFLFVEGPGSYYQASTAALKVASYLPLPYSALSFLQIIPTPLRDAVYDYIAKKRYDWFGKEDSCIIVQEEEMLKRFIDREEMVDRYNSKFF